MLAGLGDRPISTELQSVSLSAALLPAGSPDREGYIERLELYRAKKPYRDQPKAR